MGTSIIDQRNDWFHKSRQIVVQGLEKRKPKKYNEIVLMSIIIMFLGQSKVEMTLIHQLEAGHCRFKDFGFKRRCLNAFFKYGIISPKMEHSLKTLPTRTQKIFQRVEDRTEWIKNRLYYKREPN